MNDQEYKLRSLILSGKTRISYLESIIAANKFRIENIEHYTPYIANKKTVRINSYGTVEELINCFKEVDKSANYEIDDFDREDGLLFIDVDQKVDIEELTNKARETYKAETVRTTQLYEEEVKRLEESILKYQEQLDTITE
jgi:cob(I)alamin adenosyltransferase